MKKHYKTQIQLSTNFALYLLWYDLFTNLEDGAIATETNLHNFRHDTIATETSECYDEAVHLPNTY